MGNTRRRTETHRPFLFQQAPAWQCRTLWWDRFRGDPKGGRENVSFLKTLQWDRQWKGMLYDMWYSLKSPGEIQTITLTGKAWPHLERQRKPGSSSYLCSDLPALPSWLSYEAQPHFLSLSFLKQASYTMRPLQARLLFWWSLNRNWLDNAGQRI